MQTTLATTAGAYIQAHQELSSLFERFISFVDSPSVRTRETYTMVLRLFSNWLSSRGITEPRREDIIAYREELKTNHAPATVNLYILAIRRFFQWTADERIYPNVADRLKGAKLDSGESRTLKRSYFTEQQVREVLASCDRTTTTGLRDYAMLCLIVGCGLRTIEVVRANVEDIRHVNSISKDGVSCSIPAIFVQGKGHEERADYVLMDEAVEKALRAYLSTRGAVNPKAPLFPSTSRNSMGERMTTRSVRGIAKAHFRAVGIDDRTLSTHSLRHSAITLAVGSGETLERVKQFARHKNIATTMAYVHALEKARNTCHRSIAKAFFS